MIYMYETGELITRQQGIAQVKNVSQPQYLTNTELAGLLGGIWCKPFVPEEGYIAVGEPRANIASTQVEVPYTVQTEITHEDGTVSVDETVATRTERQYSGSVVYDVITLAEYDAIKAAETDAATSAAAKAAQTRILGLVDAYGADIAIMGRLLAVFGLAFPCEPSDVITLIKGGLATGQIELDKAPYADTLEARYNTVRAAMSDSEIAAVAAILRGQQQ